MDRYVVTGELGKGTWGTVRQAEQKSTGRIVAIKKIKSEKPEDGINFTALREVKLLRDFRHPNIIELVDCFVTTDLALCLVYECAHTDLEKILKLQTGGMSQADVKRHTLTLLTAVEACHARWILHRDLKPDNMLYMKDGTMKLADFGLARMYGTPKRRLSPEPITLWYKPPEMLLGAVEYNSAADMWSVGCIFAEMLLKRTFLDSISGDIGQLEKIFNVFGTPTETSWPDHKSLPLTSRGLTWDECPHKPFEDIFTNTSEDALSLLRSIMVLNPNERFSATQALNHPYFMIKPPATPTANLKLN